MTGIKQFALLRVIIVFVFVMGINAIKGPEFKSSLSYIAILFIAGAIIAGGLMASGRI